MLDASAVPVMVGVASFVMLSVFVPESLDAIRSREAGAAGAVLSICISSAEEAVLTLPALSVATIVMKCPTPVEPDEDSAEAVTL